MNSTPEPTSDRLDDPEVLLFERSPLGTLDAIVQQDGRTVYFYLSEPEDGRPRVFGTRACWVRNLKPGPLVLDEDEMRRGISPMLPRTQCVNRDPQPLPSPDSLDIVWLEEGNGAALVEQTNGSSSSGARTLAIIPPWSGLEGFHGYAADCAIESPLCWPMPENPNLHQRIQRAQEFWQQWNDDPDPFSILQPQILTAYDRRFGSGEYDPSSIPNNQTYFAIDGGEFPPRGLVQYQIAHATNSNTAPEQQLFEIVIATVGMSLFPQPAVEIFTDDPKNYRRIELAIRTPVNNTPDPESQLEMLSRQLAGLAAYPWKKFTWLGPGHTCGFQGVIADGETALLVHDRQWATTEREQVALPEFRGDPVNLLWLRPISNREQQQLQDKSISADDIIRQNR